MTATEVLLSSRIKAEALPKGPTGECTVEGCDHDALAGDFHCAEHAAQLLDGEIARQRKIKHLLSGTEKAHLKALEDRARKLRKRAAALQADIAFDNRSAKTLAAALKAVKTELRLNVRSQKQEIRNGSGDWTELPGRPEKLLREKIAETCTYVRGDGTSVPLRWSQGGEVPWDDVVLAHCEEVDPFLEWLEALPAWDSKPRLDSLLTTCFRAERCALTTWASRQPFMVATKRAFAPGSKADEVVTLVGAQGIGKSEYFGSMVPSEQRGYWFSDALRFSNEQKVMLEATLGFAIVEASELAGASRTEREHIKSWLTRQVDNGVRLAYGKGTVSLPRRFVVVATSNDPQCLPNDPSGNRRFVPVACRKAMPIAALQRLMSENRRQLWAEAVHRVKSGEPHWLHTEELRDAQAEQAEGYRHADMDLEDRIAGLLMDEGTIREIADACGVMPSEGALSLADQSRVGRALAASGWAKQPRKQVAGKRVVTWRKD